MPSAVRDWSLVTRRTKDRAAQAAQMAHQAAKANSYYSQLLKNCDGGKHSDRPELRNAKTEVAKNGE